MQKQFKAIYIHFLSIEYLCENFTSHFCKIFANPIEKWIFAIAKFSCRILPIFLGFLRIASILQIFLISLKCASETHFNHLQDFNEFRHSHKQEEIVFLLFILPFTFVYIYFVSFPSDTQQVKFDNMLVKILHKNGEIKLGPKVSKKYPKHPLCYYVISLKTWKAFRVYLNVCFESIFRVFLHFLNFQFSVRQENVQNWLIWQSHKVSFPRIKILFFRHPQFYWL